MTTNASCKLHITRLNGDTSTVNAAQVGIFKQCHEVSLRCLHSMTWRNAESWSTIWHAIDYINLGPFKTYLLSNLMTLATWWHQLIMKSLLKLALPNMHIVSRCLYATIYSPLEWLEWLLTATSYQTLSSVALSREPVIHSTRYTIDNTNTHNEGILSISCFKPVLCVHKPYATTSKCMVGH